MNINRHNYETYFLLYIDKELSIQDSNALELFIAENADLKRELEMLQQTVLAPEKVIFQEKKTLLKNAGISPEMEEQLLLYIDNELAAVQIKTLQVTIATDEKLASALYILQQTKLRPDNDIIFIDKQSLYRKEKDNNIGFGWRRLAIAAILIGFSIWGGTIYYNTTSHSDVNQSLASLNNQKALQKKSTNNIPLNNKGKLIDKITAENTSVAEKNILAPEQNIAAENLPDGNNKQLVVDARKPETAQKTALKMTIILPKPLLEPAYKNNEEPTVKVTEPMQQLHNDMQFSADQRTVEAVNAARKNTISSTAFINNSIEEKEDHFTLSDDEPKRSRLSGFLRQAKRVLERNTNLDNSDNNIKVANLTFTIH